MMERNAVRTAASLVFSLLAVTPLAVAGCGSPSRPDPPEVPSPPAPPPDPAAEGIERVQTETYDLGAGALTIPGFGDVELQGVVHHPVTVAGRHLPLVVFVHGMHSSCEGLAGSQSWPCPASDKPIPNDRGYD